MSPFFTGDWAADADCRAPLPQLEALEDVERAFVHVDYEKRSWPEHKVRGYLQGRALPVGWTLGSTCAWNSRRQQLLGVPHSTCMCAAMPLLFRCLWPHR